MKPNTQTRFLESIRRWGYECKIIGEAVDQILEDYRNDKITLCHHGDYTCHMLTKYCCGKSTETWHVIQLLGHYFCWWKECDEGRAFINHMSEDTESFGQWRRRQDPDPRNWPKSWDGYYADKGYQDRMLRLRLEWLYFVKNQCEYYRHI